MKKTDLKIPPHVPEEICSLINRELFGGDIFEGWLAWLDKADKELKEVDEWIRVRTLRGEINVLDSLRRDKASITERRDKIAIDVECWLRIATDLRMKECFEILHDALPSSDDRRGFVSSAVAALIDYTPFRDRVRKAEALKADIAAIADKLAGMIREYSKFGMSGPSEFYSIPHLLRKTDNNDFHGHDLHIWRSVRGYVVGDMPEHKKSQSDSSSIDPKIIKIVPVFRKKDVKRNPEEEVRNMLRYAWGKAPSFDALLDTVASGARKFQPAEHGMIGAGISKRQHSEKAAYLRAFAHLLDDVHRIDLTPSLMRAMAAAGNVVLDLKSGLLTFDYVRKTFQN